MPDPDRPSPPADAQSPAAPPPSPTPPSAGLRLRTALRRTLRILRRARDGVLRVLAAVGRDPRARRAGRALRPCARAAAVAAAGAAVLFALAWLGLRRVPADRIGVKQGRFGGQGIVARDFAPGLHWSLRGVHGWHLFDATVQIASFGWHPDGPLARGPLDVRLRDANLVSIAVAVPFRIRPDGAHRIVADGRKGTYAKSVVATVEKVLRAELSELDTAALLETDARAVRLEAALARLNELLAPLHVRAETIAIDDFAFPAIYEKKLMERQLERQLALQAPAHSEVREVERAIADFEGAVAVAEKERRARLERELDAARVEVQAEIAALEREAADYAARRRADADARYTELVAQGRLADLRAEAAEEELRAALWAGEGGRVLLARAAAERLRFSEVKLDTRDPRVPTVLDLDALAALLLGGSPP